MIFNLLVFLTVLVSACRYMLAHAPVGKSEEELAALLAFSEHYAARLPVPLNVNLSLHAPRGFKDFELICAQYGTLDLYLWLQMRFPEYFTEVDLCLQQKELALKHIELFLLRRQSAGIKAYTHLTTYRKIRASVGDKLPAAEHEHIRQSTLQNMESVRQSELVIMRSDKKTERADRPDVAGRGARRIKYEHRKRRSHRSERNSLK